MSKSNVTQGNKSLGVPYFPHIFHFQITVNLSPYIDTLTQKYMYRV